MRGRSCIILVVSLLFFLGVSSCSPTKREILIQSLPKDAPWSWLTRAKWIALAKGKEIIPNLMYDWSSKVIYISGERTQYSINYVHGEGISSVMLIKKHGSFVRAVSYDEEKGKYYLKDRDFHKIIEERYLTKEEAYGLAYNFFKELDRYGLE